MLQTKSVSKLVNPTYFLNLMSIKTDAINDMKKQNILILSEDLDNIKNLENIYKNEKDLEIHIVYKASDALSNLLTKGTDLVVFNVDDFSMNKLDSVLELRNIGGDFPVLTLAQKSTEEAFQEVAKIEQALILSQPYDNEQVLKLSKKMAEDSDTLIQRRFQRFKTGQKAIIRKQTNGIPIDSKVCDISKGGARLLVDKKSNINASDLIKIEFCLDRLSKRYNLYSEVAWVNKNYSKDQYMLGVKYLSETMYLKKMAG